MGLRQSAIFLRDSRGERLISSEGYATRPAFAADGRSVYYLLRRESLRAPSELWRAQLSSGRNDRLLPGFSIDNYQISPDGREVLFETIAVQISRGRPTGPIETIGKKEADYPKMETGWCQHW